MVKRLLPPPTAPLPRAGLGARAAPSAPPHVFVPPGLAQAPVLDLMCSQFVLALAAREGPRFNLRRDLPTLLALAGRHLVWPLTVLQRLRGFLASRCRGHELWQGHEALPLEGFMERHGLWRGPYEEGTLFFHLDEYAREAPRDLLAVLACTGEWLVGALKARSTLVEKNIDALAGVLQLNRAERALLLYGTLARYQRELRSLLVEFKVSNAAEAYGVIADLAGVKASEVAEALRAGSRLERIGLVENLLSEHNITDLADLMKVSERLPPVLMRPYRDRRELMAVFTRPAPRSTLGPTDFAYVEQDLALLARLLREAVAQGMAGVNVLIYGPPGMGKTELVRVAAAEAGLELFEVEVADRDGHALSGRDRYRSLQIAQVFLKGTARSVLLFDEVEDVFPTLSGETARDLARAEHGGGPGGKAWVNQILESNPVPTLWVTNRIAQIDPAFRRRFAYHLELLSPPPGAREQLVRGALAGVAASEALVQRLCARPGLTPAQIRTAVRFARLAAPAAATELDGLIERQLRHADHALGRRQAVAQRVPPTTWRPDRLNLKAPCPLPRLIEALRLRGEASLCFHGPPGTGKTALAEHLAQALDRPLMVRRASDLVSKFVGETEQQLAAMFREAQAEQALLLLDEADSFLQDRRGALRPHEISEVNEMLQGMERFAGLFICTTNLMDSLDAAALRRFTFKIRFLPLSATQRRAMFVEEALQGDAARLDAALTQGLERLDGLCPGDFATVRRQALLLGDALDPHDFLDRLQAEWRLKPEHRGGRPAGFL